MVDHIVFVVEQTLGHKTHTLNLKSALEQTRSVHPAWVLPEWNKDARKLPLIGTNWTFQAGWQARSGLRAIRKIRDIDGLFFHTQVPAVLCRGWVGRYPSVISIDATPGQYDRLGEHYQHKVGPSWLEKIKHHQIREVFLAARHVVAWSEWAKQGLVEEFGISPEKITVIPPGVHVKDWNLTKPHQQANDTVKILFVGGDWERKGGQVLLEAFRSLRERELVRPDGSTVNLELHLVTEGLVPEEPGVFVYNDIHPNDGRLKALYQYCDIFCLPTYGDCLPMVLAEAGAAGLPLISTQVAAIPEIVSDGETGYLIQPGDTAALASSVESLATDFELRNRLGQSAFRLVSRCHDADENANRLIALINKTVDHAKKLL